MRKQRNTQMIQLFILLVSLRGAYAVNFTDCFINFRRYANASNYTGLVSANGSLVVHTSDIANATGMTYGACRETCGRQTETPIWSIFSQQFSAWLLPYLALISQLPFGSKHRVSNLMSAVLTVGSPVLAGYSIILTVLNARWISRQFQNVSYPNAGNAIRILISLQQSPLRITNENSLLSSLVVLPENDDWWNKTAEFLNYTNTWSIASATSIGWVVIAYLLTVFSSLSDVSANINSNGQGTGSVWLWLIPIVIGWLQLSPKCDHARVEQAMHNAADIAFVATAHGIKMASDLSDTRAISIDTIGVKPSSPDEDLTPPVYNYARAIPWCRSAEEVLDAFIMASTNVREHRTVRRGGTWINLRNFVDPSNRSGNPDEVDAYCQLLQNGVRSTWASGMVFRMFVASLLPLALQWATTGAAVLVVFYTPAVGLGCRSLSYLLYGAMSTIVWGMLVLSSILSHYASSYPARLKSVRVARVLANLFRWGGKFLAIVNAFCLIATGMLQFTSVYDNCYCNSSVLGLGNAGYAVIFPSDSQVHITKTAWIGALALGSSASAGFIFFMNLLTDLLPK